MTPMIIDIEWLIRILMGKNKKVMIIKMNIIRRILKFMV